MQCSSLEHNVQQTLSASSEVTLCVLSSQREGVWLAGRAGDTRQPCPVLSHERCSTNDRETETASVSCRECCRVCCLMCFSTVMEDMEQHQSLRTFLKTCIRCISKMGVIWTPISTVYTGWARKGGRGKGIYSAVNFSHHS